MQAPGAIVEQIDAGILVCHGQLATGCLLLSDSFGLKPFGKNTLLNVLCLRQLACTEVPCCTDCPTIAAKP